MKKNKLVLAIALSIVVFVLGELIINLLNKDIITKSKYTKLNWFISSIFFFFVYKKMDKKSNDKNL